jgi:DNA (cytosine-5)-methyltransferase 1
VNFYNEHDPKAAAWLRELIRCGHIADGVVDERSITELSGKDLEGFVQCHFFAGIGGWSLALRLAGWPDDRPVWTGSCPCQPFSAAGKGLGAADERHLWPEMHRLVSECRPATVFGEQVASAVALAWLDGVFTDLESARYACGAADLCSAGAGTEGFGWILRGDRLSVEPILIGSPNIRQRLYWMADAGHPQMRRGPGASEAKGGGACGKIAGCGTAGRLAEPDGREPGDRDLQRGGQHGQQPQDGGVGRLEHAQQSGLEGHSGDGNPGDQPGRINPDAVGPVATPSRPWDSFDILPCTDGKARRIESGSSPLAHGVSDRVGLLRGYGNAINPYLAAEFILSGEEALNT